MRLCKLMGCNNVECDNNSTDDDTYMNIGDFCPEIWAVVKKAANEELEKTAPPMGQNENACLCEIAYIENERDYNSLCDMIEVHTGEDGWYPRNIQSFYDVLDLIVDVALCGDDYEDNIDRIAEVEV